MYTKIFGEFKGSEARFCAAEWTLLRGPGPSSLGSHRSRGLSCKTYSTTLVHGPGATVHRGRAPTRSGSGRSRLSVWGVHFGGCGVKE